MEKPSYKPAKREEKAAFLKGKQVASNDVGLSDAKQRQLATILAVDSEHADQGGFYELEEPIPTILGPIGKWQLTPDALPNFPAIGLFGKRRTGKSFSLRNICYNCFRDVPFGVVLSDTAQNGFWQQYFPKRLVIQGLQMHILQMIIQRQKGLVAKYGVDHPSIRCIVILGKLH